MDSVSTPQDGVMPTTPILMFTPDPSETSSSTSSPSECSENSYGWPSNLTGNTASTVTSSLGNSGKAEMDQRTASKDTSYPMLHHGYGRPVVPCSNTVDFDDLLLMSQIKRGAPATPSTISKTGATSRDSNSASTTLASTGSTTYTSATETRRRHSNSYDTRIPYRQSSLKWKQRNGSATFELKLSQEEFMSRHSAVFAD